LDDWIEVVPQFTDVLAEAMRTPWPGMVMQTMNWMLWPLVGLVGVVLEMKKSKMSAK
jgi:hypothetical protein